MKVALKILWKLAQAALVVLPFLMMFMDSYAEEKGFATVYMVAMLVAVGVLVGVAYYEYQDEDPSTIWGVLRAASITVMVILVAISAFDKQRGFEDFYFTGAVVMLLEIAFYFFYLKLTFFHPEVYFTIIGIVALATFFFVPDFDTQTENVFGAIVAAFALLSFPLAWLVGKICDLFPALASSNDGGSSKRKEKKFSLSQVQNACKACYNSKYAVDVKKVGSAVEVRLRGVGGYRAGGTDAASVRYTLESKLGTDLSKTNVFINY